MKSIVINPDAPLRLGMQEVDEPQALSNQAVMRVHTVSLNRGEVAYGNQGETGSGIGWDFAGVVEKPARDGSGPKAGVRVVGIVRNAAWAERVAAPTDSIAPLPDAVTFEQAATLPVAGLTAYYSLNHAGFILGKKVMVTGGTGGVGHFAIQLAREAGAHVVAPVRRDEQRQLVLDAGAHHAVAPGVSAAEQFGPFDVVVDGVGGEELGAAMGMLALNGIAVCFGLAGGQEVTYDFLRFWRPGSTRVYGLSMGQEMRHEPGGGVLERLATMVANGTLKPLISAVRPWTELHEAAQDLLDRKYAGKVVLTVSEPT